MLLLSFGVSTLFLGEDETGGFSATDALAGVSARDEASGTDTTVASGIGSGVALPDSAEEAAVADTGASSRQPQDRSAPSAVRALDVGCGRPIEITPPASDLASVVAAAESGTCFLLAPGEYRFSNVEPKDHMTFLGTARADVRVVGDSSTENAFFGTATGVTIGRMTFTGFLGNGGTKPQEQAPVRGTSELWGSDRGEMASEWLIEDVESSNNVASGIFLGDNFTIRHGIFADNGVTGLGGSEIVGGLIEGNIVTGNGADAADGELANGGGMKFTQAIAGDEPLTVRQNEVYGNVGIGIWCDIACDGFNVEGNYIHDQEDRGIMYELSSNATIRDNLIVDANRWTNFTRDFNAGAITLGESRDVLVEGNYIEQAVAGVVVRQTRRPVMPKESFLNEYEGVTFVSGNILVRNNHLVAVEAMGVSTGATGGGLIANPDSIRFEGNAYDNPGGMAFWWNNGQRLDFNGWQGAGRDTRSPDPDPDRPQWVPLAP